MVLVLSIFGIAFAAFCVWLAVRIINRRERWAKWTLASTLMLPVFYVASFGPACWLVSHTERGHAVFTEAYRPLAFAVWRSPLSVWLNAWSYARWGMARGHNLARNPDENGRFSEYDGFQIYIDDEIDDD
jgi:hypothetical protein